MARRPTARRLAAIAVAAALAVGGCSDDPSVDESSNATTTTEADGPTTTTSAPAGSGPLERYAGYTSTNYDDPAHWLCRPDADDICDSDLDATVVAADGTLTPEPFEENDDPPVDCFYVYPTISRDPGRFSDWDAADDEEGYAALNQVARLRSVCRVFAPVYRQQTLAGLGRALGGGTGTTMAEEGDPFADVLDAWKTYMANDNDGRGVILVGHSQGSAMLNELVATEIDPHDDVRDLLVSAFLVGWAVGVPPGEDVGGQFDEVPLCREDDQFGCVATWASFRATAPPPAGAFFGAVRGAGAGELVAACTNPAALDGGPAELQAYFPSDPDASTLAALGSTSDGSASWAGGAAIPTPFVTLPGLVSGECVDGAHHVLSVTVHPDPGPRADDIGGDLTPEWGLHLVDLNLVMGDVVALAERQAEAWAAERG